MTPYYAGPLATLLCGDCIEVMAGLEAEPVDCAVTSPPYWGLRRYSGDQGDEPYGLEPTPELYIEHTIAWLRAVRRVLKPMGSLFLNLGDSYANTGVKDSSKVGGFTGDRIRSGKKGIMDSRPRKTPQGYKPLDLCGIPEQVVLAARADGWFWRSTIIWQKPNPMPESVQGWSWQQCRVNVSPRAKAEGDQQWAQETGQSMRAGGIAIAPTQWQPCPGCSKCEANDGYVLRKGSGRPTSSFEYLYMLTKTDDYYFDTEAVRMSLRPSSINRDIYPRNKIGKGLREDKSSHFRTDEWSVDVQSNPAGRNIRNVWTITTHPFSLELCKDCKRIYEPKHFRRLKQSMDSACSACGGLVMVSPDEWATWYCVDCGAFYSRSDVRKLKKRRICRCGGQ